MGGYIGERDVMPASAGKADVILNSPGLTAMDGVNVTHSVTAEFNSALHYVGPPKGVFAS